MKVHLFLKTHSGPPQIGNDITFFKAEELDFLPTAGMLFRLSPLFKWCTLLSARVTNVQCLLTERVVRTDLEPLSDQSFEDIPQENYDLVKKGLLENGWTIVRE